MPYRERARTLQTGLVSKGHGRIRAAAVAQKQMKGLSHIASARVCLKNWIYLVWYIFFINLSSAKNVKRCFKAADHPSSQGCAWKLLLLIWLWVFGLDVVLQIS